MANWKVADTQTLKDLPKNIARVENLKCSAEFLVTNDDGSDESIERLDYKFNPKVSEDKFLTEMTLHPKACNKIKICDIEFYSITTATF